jgi:hypothetical protein
MQQWRPTREELISCVHGQPSTFDAMTAHLEAMNREEFRRRLQAEGVPAPAVESLLPIVGVALPAEYVCPPTKTAGPSPAVCS